MIAANQRPILALGICIVLVGLTGCSATNRRSRTDYASLAVARQAVLSSVEREFPADAGSAAHPGGAEVPPDSDFAATHPRVQDFVERYQTNLRPYIERALQRGSKYLRQMTTILAEEGVPSELAYLPIVESGYSVQATSSAGAVGPWQFVRGTGERYGLRIDGYVDERRDPEKATRAAARYLRDLYTRFGDWHLALAGYNSGEGNIERIQNWKGCADYWEMSDRGYLPNETSEYVPRFLAAVAVARSPEEYGFDVPSGVPTRFETVDVPRTISLKAVAQLCGSDEDTIRDLNPALKLGIVPPQGYTLRLPKGTRRQFEVAFAAYREPAPVAAPPSVARVHLVRRGETLGSIAQLYGVSASALMRANGMRRSSAVKAGQQLRIPAKSRSGLVASETQARNSRVAADERRDGMRVARAERRATRFD